MAQDCRGKLWMWLLSWAGDATRLSSASNSSAGHPHSDCSARQSSSSRMRAGHSPS
jgi:hypothetical protein